MYTMRVLTGLFLVFQRLVEAAEEAHHQHEENPDLQVSFSIELNMNIKKSGSKKININGSWIGYELLLLHRCGAPARLEKVNRPLKF